MITVPAGFLATASRTHAPRWRVTMLTAAGAPMTVPLPVLGGSIDKDAASSPRTRARVTIPTRLAPALIDQNYLPVGQRLRFEYSNQPGTQVVVADLDMVRSRIVRPESVWELEAVDRAARVGLDDTARGSWAPPTTGTISAAIQYAVNRTFPGTTFSITGPAATQTVPAGDFGDGDPWQVAQTLARAAGCEVFFRAHDRVCVVRPLPDVGAPVDAVKVGPGGTVTAYTLDHEMGFNVAALVYKQKGAATVLRTGVASDTRTTSPVAVQRVGSRVVFQEQREVTAAPTQGEADSAAGGVLRRAGGRSRSPSVRHVMRPWLEPGDTIHVTYSGGPTEAQIIDSISLPLDNTNIQTTVLRTHTYQMGVPV